MGYAVSGATTISATFDTALNYQNGTGLQTRSSSVSRLSSLTAGSNTFTAKYRVSGSRGRFRKRNIQVVGIP
jgi:hypothetical protein